jgi:hypothetical protein
LGSVAGGKVEEVGGGIKNTAWYDASPVKSRTEMAIPRRIVTAFADNPMRDLGNVGAGGYQT